MLLCVPLMVRPYSACTAPRFAPGRHLLRRLMLMRGPAAVDRQRDAGDRSRRVSREEYRERAELLDRSKALVGLLRQQHVADHLVARDPVRLGLSIDLRLD